MNECESHNWSKVWDAGQATWLCMACGLTQPVGFGCVVHVWVDMLGPYAGEKVCMICNETRKIEVPDLRDRTAVETWLSA